jgi:hypothetical protein
VNILLVFGGFFTLCDWPLPWTIDTCAPQKTIRELHEVMKSGAGIDPLKNFSEADREELRAFTAQ